MSLLQVRVYSYSYDPFMQIIDVHDRVLSTTLKLSHSLEHGLNSCGVAKPEGGSPGYVKNGWT